MAVSHSDEDLRDLIGSAQTIAIVGLSPDASRDSHRIARYLQANGFTIIPVNPNTDQVLGEPSYGSLEEVPHPVDIVNVFRRPEFTPEIAGSAVEIGARVLWMQLGVVNEEAESIASNAGLDVVMDRCLMVEHRRLVK